MKTHFSSLVVCLTLFVFPAPASVLYVDLNSTSPAPPYADLTTAAVSIQDAVDAATNGDLILVNDGIYQDGFRTTAGASNGSGVESPLDKINVTNRVVLNKPVTVQSLHGPSAVLIQGSGIYRCVYLTNGATLSGFTLTNGAAGWITTTLLLERTITKTNLVNGGGVTGTWGGGCVLSNCVLTGNSATGEGGGAYDVTLIHCTLTGNTASSGGGAYGSTLFNCIVTGNSAQTVGVTTNSLFASGMPVGLGGGICSGSAYNSLIADNRAFQAGGACNAAHLVGCTVANNVASYYGGVGSGSTSYSPFTVNYGVANCIIYFNSAGTNANWGDSIYNFDHCCTLPLPASGAGNITNDPAFVDFSGGDYHLQSNSLCINSGDNAVITNQTDLDGNPRIVGGTADIGAYEFQTPSSVLSYAWAQQYGLPTDGSADFVDSDGDGMNNWQEFIAGTNPTNAASLLAMSSAVPLSGQNGVVVKWQSVDTRTYCLQRGTDLGSPTAFSTIQSNIVGQAGTTLFIDTTATNGRSFFYRVGVQ
jgi:hypothetical protein